MRRTHYFMTSSLRFAHCTSDTAWKMLQSDASFTISADRLALLSDHCHS